jgi:hypothetical protein
MVKVQCILDYNDLQLKRLVKESEELEVTKDRADTLVSKKLVKVIDVIPEPVKEEEKSTEPKKPLLKKKKK